MNAIALRAQNSHPAPPHRKGWCPGALKPMETGDGLLARVRAPRGRLSLDQAAALAGAAIACGNGAIGLTARANLHLRGLSEGTLPDLHARLEGAGLIDADPEIERLRNIVASPLDDLDPEALFDLGPSVAALEMGLAQDEALRRLPAKFSFVFDALGRLPLGDIEADIRFEASHDGMLDLFLAGDDALAARCAPAEAGDVAARLGLLGAAATRRRGGCARWSSGQALPHCSQARIVRQCRGHVRNDALCCGTSLVCANSARRSSLARRCPSAKSRRFGSKRWSNARARLTRAGSGLRLGALS
jgi:Nitrite/Sulfite reductase ferredoxin-like half domain